MNQTVRNGLVAALALAAVLAAVWGALGSGWKEESRSQGETDPAVSTEEPAKDATGKQTDELPPALSQEGPLRGERLPDIMLVNRNGDPVSLRDNGGKPAIINVWASWCPPCKKEMPDLQAAYEKHGDQVQFHMVNLTNRDSLDQMDEYLKKEAFTFPVLLDEEGVTEKQLQILGIPNTFVVDETGRIIHHIGGYMDSETVERIMDELTS